ncbi:MAG TPA: DNA topoisomerase, partial [Thermomicrobiales bacterium]|nr:DNA topoisomerase [Thermomicrobiales bacterium]
MTAEKPKRTTSAATGTRTATKKAGTTRKKSTTTTKATSRSTASRRVPSGGKLVIVESPAKARTIERYLGRGYSVRASMGHVRDLPKSKLGIDVDDNFEPTYRVPNDKLKTVKELKELVKGASEVILATDPDREGEAIAWHLVQATLPEGGNVRRVVFNEITPDAVRNAMDNPRDIDMDLVDAQQARRVLDRLVGYSISPLLWKKVKRGLSAGRVQSVALRLVVERERAIQEFVPVEYWSLDAELAQQQQQASKLKTFLAGLSRIRGEKAELPNAWVTDEVVQGLNGAQYVVANVQTKETQRRPAAPFITSTLQQEASRKLNYPVRRTMQIAQELYEGVDLGPEGTQGLITYMGTDS